MIDRVQIEWFPIQLMLANYTLPIKDSVEQLKRSVSDLGRVCEKAGLVLTDVSLR